MYYLACLFSHLLSCTAVLIHSLTRLYYSKLAEPCCYVKCKSLMSRISISSLLCSDLFLSLFNSLFTQSFRNAEVPTFPSLCFSYLTLFTDHFHAWEVSSPKLHLHSEGSVHCHFLTRSFPI